MGKREEFFSAWQSWESRISTLASLTAASFGDKVTRKSLGREGGSVGFPTQPCWWGSGCAPGFSLVFVQKLFVLLVWLISGPLSKESWVCLGSFLNLLLVFLGLFCLLQFMVWDIWGNKQNWKQQNLGNSPPSHFLAPQFSNWSAFFSSLLRTAIYVSSSTISRGLNCTLCK